MRDLTPQQQEEYQLKGQGVLVEKLEDGLAREAGIRAGDVILMINNLKVESSHQFKELTKDLPEEKAIPVLILRRGNPLFLALKISR